MEIAIQSNNPELFAVLVDNSLLSCNLPRVFHQALLSPNPAFLEILCNRVLWDMNTNFLFDGLGYASPLQLVIQNIHKVKILIQHGANVNYVAYGYPPIQLAFEHGNLAVIRLLLEYGANTNNINLEVLLSSPNFLNNAKKNLELLPFLQSLYSLESESFQRIDQWMRDSHLMILGRVDKVDVWHEYMGFSSEREEIKYIESLMAVNVDNKMYNETYTSWELFTFNKDGDCLL